MNFQIDRNTLLRALERTRNAVITHRETYKQGSWFDVFKCYIFTADCDQLTIETSNSEIYMRETVSIGNPTADKKTFAVNAKQLISAIKSLDGQSLEFDVLEYQVIVRHSIGSFALPIFEGIEDYSARRKPAINYDTAQHIEMEAPGLRSILNRLAFAMADDDLRPVMNGVIISMKKEHTDFVASDGHVLAKIRKQSITTEKPADVVLPRRIIGILQKVLPATGFVEMDFNAFDVNWPTDSKEPQPAPVYQITVDGTTIVGRPIEGRYPNYDSVIPTQFSKGFTTDRVALIKSLERLSQFTSNSGLITIHLNNGSVKMDAADYDFSLSATEVLPCSYYGDPFKFGLQDFRLIKMLKSIVATTEATFRIVDQSRAIIIEPGVQPLSEEITMLIMPMLIRD